ncbi:hypothetical protein BYZ73_16490 [Rhodovulum viride]|uniref:Uncharacterized protein n=1 Tax=Rhodovulum viride TaxID=1231134 RepID=A0ABX9DDG3_9RHOB|nr:hypothetical protein [Rhodovulum viride]RAP40138.1 hypothetical protein BYZ73_16490 [Rhodovulum viride]
MLTADWKSLMEDGRKFEPGHLERLPFENGNFLPPDGLFDGLPEGMSQANLEAQPHADFILKGSYFIPNPMPCLDEKGISAPIDLRSDMMADLGNDEATSEDASALRAAPPRFVPTRDVSRAIDLDELR